MSELPKTPASRRRFPDGYSTERYRSYRERQQADPLAFRPGRTILALLGAYGYLTVAQMLRLRYGPSQRSYVTSWLNHLKNAGLVHDANFAFNPRTNKANMVWTFTERGRQRLVNDGMTEIPKSHHRRTPPTTVLDHTIAVNDALIACELLARRYPEQVELLGFKCDELLHAHPMQIQLPSGKRTDVVPDGWAAYGIGESKLSVCLEVDRATENKEGWKAKVRGYVLALSGNPSAFQRVFSMRATKVLVVVTPKRQSDYIDPGARLGRLKTWTEEVLTELGDTRWGRYFRFTTADPVELDPRVFFGSPVWEVPFAGGKEPALPGIL